MKGTILALSALALAAAAAAGTVVAKPAPLGSPVVFRRAPDALRVTAVRLIDPVRVPGQKAAPGRRLVAVKVRLTNVGTRALFAKTTNCAALERAALVDARGSSRGPRRGLSPNLARYFAAGANPYQEAHVLRRGETLTGFYTFELRAKTRPALFSFAPCNGPHRRWRLR
ncbi:MAG: hypothetical protein ABR521_12320 [Gaiellaceae bacterium]